MALECQKNTVQIKLINKSASYSSDFTFYLVVCCCCCCCFALSSARANPSKHGKSRFIRSFLNDEGYEISDEYSVAVSTTQSIDDILAANSTDFNFIEDGKKLMEYAGKVKRKVEEHRLEVMHDYEKTHGITEKPTEKLPKDVTEFIDEINKRINEYNGTFGGDSDSE